MNKLLQNTYVRYGVALAIGAAISAIFYPTKSIEREIEAKYESKKELLIEDFKTINNRIEKEKTELSQEVKQLQIESSAKISSLKVENTQLKSKVKESKFKIVRPDGTVEEKWFKESETDIVSSTITSIKSEYARKVKSIENKWKTVHTKRVKIIKENYEKKLQEKETVIASYKKKESIQINPRSFGVAFGVMSDDQYYGNISYDVYGPWFLNLQVESDQEFQNGSGGFGLGLRF